MRFQILRWLASSSAIAKFACLAGWPLLLILFTSTPAAANHAPLARDDVTGGLPLPSEETDVRIVGQKLEIELGSDSGSGDREANVPARPVFAHGLGVPVPRAAVHAQYVLENPTTEPRTLDLAFPVFASSNPRDGWFTVEVDGELVKVETDVAGEQFAVRMREHAIRFADALRQWAQRDPVLDELLEEYHQLRHDRDEYTRLRHQLSRPARELLLDTSRHSALMDYLLGLGDRNTLWDLLPEADEQLRSKAGRGGREYLPLIDRTSRTRIVLDEETLRHRIDRWLAEHPQLLEHAEALRPMAERHHQAAEVRTSMQTRLIREHRLSEQDTAFVLRILTSEGSHPTPPYPLMETLTPEVAQEVDRTLQEHHDLAVAWGHSHSLLSPLTGHLYEVRDGFRDSSMDRLLGQPVPEPPLHERYLDSRRFGPGAVGQPSGSLLLMRYRIELPAGAKRTVQVRYETAMNADVRLYNNIGAPRTALYQFRYILRTVSQWAHFGPIEVTVSAPSRFLAVMRPEPAEIVRCGDDWIYRVTLRHPKENLHVALLADTRMFSSIPAEEAVHEELTALLERVEHGAAVRVLQRAILHVETDLVHSLGALDRLQQLRASMPPWDPLPLISEHQEQYLLEKRQWIDRQANAPELAVPATGIDRRMVPRRYEPPPSGRWPLHESSLQDHRDFAAILQKARPDEPPDQAATRLFMLSRFDQPEAVPQHLDSLGELVRQEPEAGMRLLRLATSYLNDSRPLPPELLIELFRQYAYLGNREAPTAARSAIWLLARQAEDLGAVNEILDLLDEPVPRRSTYVAELLSRLSMAPSPELAEALVRLEPSLLVPRAAGVDRYRAFLNARPELRRAFEVKVEEYRPDLWQSTLNYRLAQGDRSGLERVIETYNTSDEQWDLGWAVRVLRAWDDPKIFEQLEFRPVRGNNTLLELLANGPVSDAGFAFAEQVYQQQYLAGEPNFGGLAEERLASIFIRSGRPEGRQYAEEILKRARRPAVVGRLLGEERLREEYGTPERD